MYRAPIETLRWFLPTRSPARRRCLWVAGSVLAAICALPSPSQAASPVGTTNAADAFSSASRFYSHYANGRFWVAYHNGTTGPVIASSPDGVTWTQQGLIFSGVNPSSAGQWAARFSGNVVIAFGTNPSNPRRRWYRNATLNGNGTVTWNAIDNQAASTAGNLEVNSLIANNKPILWFVDATSWGDEVIGSQLNGPAWNSPAPTPPAPFGASGGGFSAGAIFPTGGADPGDYIVLRATTTTTYTAGSHRLLADRFDASVPGYVSSTNWYDVSRIGINPGPFVWTESPTTEVKEGTDFQSHLRFAAVRDSGGNIHAVYVNRLDDVVHYKKDVGFNDSWSRVSTDVTQSAFAINRVALSASAPGNNLVLFYSKSDDGIYYRRFDGSAWGGETTLRSASPIPLQGALATLESATSCSEGVAWVEGTASPFNVMFATLAGAGCGGPPTGTFTFETPDVKMVWDSGPNNGGGLSEFYAKNEPNAAVNRVGDFGYNLFSTQFTQQLASGDWHFEGYDTVGGGRMGTLYVLETTPSRARVRQQYDYTPAIHLDRDWTAYAYPRLTIDETLIFDSTQNIRGATGLHPKGETTCGGSNTFYCAGKSDESNRIWVTTDNATTYSDMLAIPYEMPFFGRAGASYSWQSVFEANTPNTFFARVHESSLVAAGPGSATRLYIFYPHLAGLTSTGTEWQPYANDYRVPDLLTIAVGSPWQDGDEHTGAGDFFNEAENAYLLNLDPVLGLSFDIDGLTTNRKKPFFKMRQWRSLQPPAFITREGATLIRDVHYKADVKPISRGHFCTPACTELANGGLVGDPNEYLNDPAAARNFTLDFVGANTLYLGTDAKFRGLNFGLATVGAGTANLQWQYWDGTSWMNLQAVSGFLDETNNLKTNGSIHWGADPTGWMPTSVNGGPALYYVRAMLASGSYAPPPVERLVRTDILLFQYLSDITLDGQTFVLSPPTTAATNYRSIGTALDYGTGRVSATNGSTLVTGAGTLWRTANRGRGDRIRIDLVDYTIASVDSETQLRLTESFVGATGTLKIYSIARKFATLTDWESCVDGIAPPPTAPCEGVASGSFVVDDRSEVGVAYKETPLAGVVIDGATTDAAHTITLTADSGNRHNGIAGSAMVIDNTTNPSPAVEVRDDFVTVEWLEIRGGGAPAADGIFVDILTNGANANQIVLRQNLIHNVSGAGIEINDPDTIVDAYNNFIYRNGLQGIHIFPGALASTSRLRLLNNSIFANTQEGVFKTPGVSPATILLRNNISHSNGTADFATDPADSIDPVNSSDNLSSDLTATTHSPGGGGINSAGSADALFRTVTVGTEDLHLESAGAAVNQGVDLSGIFTEDIDGATRIPLWDIGADDTSAPPQAAVYYSVGASWPADLMSGATISIAAGTATFSQPQPDNVGVGDEITYNGASIAYISGRTSSTVYSVTTATGGEPPDVAGQMVDAIRRAFKTLTEAEANSPDATHLNTSNLVAAALKLHWAMYNDGPMDDGRISIDGYTTGANNYIRIFTPVAPSEVGTRQRHTGKAGTGFRLVDINAAPTTPYEIIRIMDEHVRIEGIEIDGSGVTGSIDFAGIRTDSSLTPAADVRIDKVIIHDITNTAGAANDIAGINVGGDGSFKLSNSIMYRMHNGTNDVANSDTYGVRLGSGSAAAIFFHSNTIYDVQNLVTPGTSIEGISHGGTGVFTVRNTAVLNVKDSGGIRECFATTGPAFAGNNNVSSDATAPGAASQINKTAYASYFVSIAAGSEDLHLRNNSASLWGANGADLDTDPNLPVVDDIDGEPRHASLPNIGADEATANLWITKDDFQASAVRGDPVTYTITVTNLGPSGATGAMVTDTLPAWLTGASWSCTASLGSSCTASGSGNILDTVNLLPTGTATYTLPANNAQGATSPLDNTATITPPGGVTDPDTTNNSATDSDTLTSAADVAITKQASPNPVPVGVDLTYTLRVTNNGPSNTTNVHVTDTLPPGVVFQSATPPCTHSAGVVDCLLGPMAAGAPPTFLTVVVRATAAGTIVNQASVTHDTGVTETNPSNNTAFATTLVPAWRATGSLALPRTGHSTTLLQNGKVLVVGGEIGPGLFTPTTEVYDPLSGTWSAAAPLGVARGWHTATLLPSGKVLVAGGRDAAGTLSLADLYDPQAGTWTSTGVLGGDREFHTATLLGDGRVLVAGGFSTFTGVRQTAELYDWTSGSWSGTPGVMNAGRQHHTATIVPNGKVLLAGGVGANSSELFDPATGLFAPTVGVMSQNRDRHSATLLPNGKVLVAGSTGGVSSAEIFDPGTGSWSPAASLSGLRSAHTATLLPGGRVLVAGSADPSSSASSELYDPGSGTWSAGPPLPGRRSSHTSTILPDGHVLLVGGLDPVTLAYVGSAELYETTGGFTFTGTLGIVRFAHTTTLLPNGKVLAAGDGALSSAPTELYDPASGLWTPTASGLQMDRYGHTATLLVNDKVLVAGGHGGGAPLAKAELFDPATSSWLATGDMNVAREAHTATLLPDGTTLVAGGFTGSCIPSYEVYRPLGGTWQLKGVMPTCRSQHASVLLLDGKVLLIGGTQDGFTPLVTTILYDPVGNSWTPQGNLLRPRQFPSATLLPNGKVLVTGGTDDPLTEIYDPTTGNWSSAGNLNAARANAAATLLPSGWVLVAGGTLGATVRQSAEIWDPATLTWTLTGALVAPRYGHSAQFLTNGKVLIAGGLDSGGPPGLMSSELYDPLLGFLDAWRPVLSSAMPDPLLDSDSLLAGGTQFRGISEASGSQGAQDSSTDYPLVQLRRLDNDAVRWLPLDPSAGWTDGSFRSLPLVGLVPGEALLTVFTNGIPSISRTVTVECPAATFNSTPGDQDVCAGSTVQFTVSVNGSNAEFQWRKNGIPLVDGGRITGSQTATLQIANVNPGDTGDYDVVVSLACSSVLAISTPAALTVTDALTSVTAGPPGPWNVCQATGCTAGPVAESHLGGGAVTHQWGFRTFTGGPITDIPGATAQNYTIQGTDFPGPGTYYLVVRTQPTCGTRLTSNEITVIVDAAVATDTVRYLTVTSKDSENVLEWLNPLGFGNVTIRSRSLGAASCTYPTAVDGSDGSLPVGPPVVPGSANEPNRFTHGSRNNGHRYCYTVWVDKGGGSYSAGKNIQGRPFAVVPDPAPGAKWGYNMGIFSMVPPGNGVGVVYAVANDGSLHSMVKGIPPSGEGGYWPGPFSSLPVWKPQSMNGPSQGRPSGIPVPTAGSTRTIFLSSQDGHVYAFNAYTGALAWSPSSPALAPAPYLGAHPSGVFTVFGSTQDLIFVGTRDDGGGSKFYALRLLDGDTGGPGWVFDGGTDGKIGAINGQAAIDQNAGRVYFTSREFDATNNKTVWCLEYDTGNPCWPAQAHGSIDTGTTMYNDRLFVGTHNGTNGEVKSIKASDGSLDWVFPLPIAEGVVKGYVAVDRLTGNSYFSTTTSVRSLDPAGSERWACPSLSSPSIPVYAPGDLYVYVGGGDGQLHRLIANGAFGGTEDTTAPFPLPLGDGSAAVGSPTYDLSARFLYVGSENGIVYAVKVP